MLMIRLARLIGCVVVALVAAAPVAAPAHAATLGGWNAPEQRAVARAGVLERLGGRLAGERRLSSGQLRTALRTLATRTGAPAQRVSGGTVSVVRFDRLLVLQLGLGDVAEHVQRETIHAGLHPPRFFGTEVVARYLGLRVNHPAPDDALELYPWDPITRAEAAHSLLAVLRFSGWQVGDARATLGGFALPRYSPGRKRVLRIAVSRIGMPYVWGGEADRAVAQSHGGYDCSGFVWRVFGAAGLGGRTAAQMAGSIPRGARVRLDDVRPADQIFFGSARFGSRATEASITHTGIALSRDWVIHSSAQGVYVLPLRGGWLRERFAWARDLL